MSKIIGVTVGTPISPKKIGEKLKLVNTVNGNAPDENGNVEVDANGYVLTGEDIENIARSAANLLAEGNSGVILEEKSYSGFFGATATNGEMVYVGNISDPIKFYEGEIYTVVFDGVSYECEAITFGSSGAEQIGIRNYPDISGGGDWFEISYGANKEDPHGANVFTIKEGTTHTIGIYKAGATRFLTDEDRLELQSQIDEIERQVKEIQENPFTFDDITPEQREELKGEDGKSAYDIALETGFSGTEAEWLASLKGADGADGKDGTNGKDGVNGKDGKDGEDYILTDADMENIAQMASELLSGSGYLKGVTCTQAEYDAMVAAGTIDSTTLYAIVG